MAVQRECRVPSSRNSRFASGCRRGFGGEGEEEETEGGECVRAGTGEGSGVRRGGREREREREGEGERQGERRGIFGRGAVGWLVGGGGGDAG